MHKAFSGYKYYTAITNYASEKYSSNKNLILEPLSCVLKIVILQYKPEGTKISIVNNAILYDEPSFGQGILRMFNGDCREDLHNLYFPLKKCIQWYSSDDPHFQYIYRECIKGLLLLKNVYTTNTTIHHTLNHYINILKNDKDATDAYESQELNPIIDTLQEIWTPGEIKAIYELLMLVHSNKNKDIYINALEDIVSAKEKFINEYIHKVSTSY